MTALVGIDVGTSGVKAIALSTTGQILARAERDYRLSTPRPGWAEQDPDDWARAADAALGDLGVEPAAIGWSGQMHGLVVLDEAGQVIRPAILWNDQRTAAECAEIEDRIGLERLIQLTGNRALTGFTAPKLLWLRTHEPATFARIAHVLLPKDYVRFRRTGEHAIDAALQGADAAYVALDCDVAEPGELAVFMPEPNGLALAEIERLLAGIAGRTRVAGLGLTGLVADPANEPKLARLCSALGL